MLVETFRPLKTRPAGRVTPLQNILTFATERDVEAMRELLLMHGAHESEEDGRQRAVRQKADFCENARLSEHYDDPRGFNPWSATLEMGM